MKLYNIQNIFLICISFTILKSEEYDIHVQRTSFINFILSKFDEGLTDENNQLLKNLRKDFSFFSLYGIKPEPHKHLKGLQLPIKLLKYNSFVAKYLSPLCTKINNNYENKTSMYLKHDVEVEFKQEVIDERDVCIELNNILSTEEKSEDKNKKTAEELKQYFEHINGVFQKLKTDQNIDLPQSNPPITDRFNDIINEMNNEIGTPKSWIDLHWIQWRYPEVKYPEGWWQDCTTVHHNYQSYYNELSSKMLHWKNKREIQKKIFENNQITFDGIKKDRIAYDPLSIKNNLELDLYNLHEALALAYTQLKENDLKNKNHLVFKTSKDFPCYEVRKADLENTEYKKNNIYDAQGNMTETHEKRIIEKYYKKSDTAGKILNEIHGCLIETNNCKQEKNIKLARQIEELAEKIEDKKAIRQEKKGYNDESAILPVNNYRVADIIKDSLDDFFHMIVPEVDSRVYDDIKKKNKYTQYKIKSHLGDFIAVGKGIDFNDKIYDGRLQEYIKMATINPFDEEFFYQKIKEYKDDFRAVYEPNDLGRVKIYKRMNKYNQYNNNHKTFDDFKLEILKEISLNTEDYLKSMALREERKSYCYSDPILKKIMEDSYLLYQNGFYSRNYNYETKKSYSQYIELLKRHLDKYSFLRLSGKYKNDESHELNKIKETFENIEKIYFKLLLLEYNEFHNFDHWWTIYTNSEEKTSENIFEDMLKKSLNLQSGLYLEKLGPQEHKMSQENNKIKSFVYVTTFNQELQKCIRTVPNFNDFKCNLAKTKIKNLQNIFHKNLLERDKESYIIEKKLIQNSYYDYLYDHNQELNSSNAVKYKNNFLNISQEYPSTRNDSRSATDIVVEGMSERHFDVLKTIYIDPLSRITKNISQSVFQNSLFWSDIIPLYNKYCYLQLDNVDVRLDYYIQKKFNSIFNDLQKNKNIVSSSQYREFDALNNFLTKVKGYIENKEHYDNKKKYIAENIRELKFDNNIYKEIIEILEKDFPLGFLQYSNEQYEKFSNTDNYELNNALKSKNDNDNLLQLCLFYCSHEPYMFYHKKWIESEKEYRLIKNNELKEKNQELKEKNNAYFKNSISIYGDLINQYIDKIYDYFQSIDENYLNNIIDIFSVLDRHAHLKNIVEDLLSKYEESEPNCFTFNTEYNKLIFSSQYQASLQNKIKEWSNKYNQRDLHQSYIGYACASIIDTLLQYYIKDEYTQKNDSLIIDNYINEYKEMYKFTCKFLQNINYENNKAKLKDKINKDKINNYKINKDKVFVDQCVKAINNYIGSYEKITMNTDLIEAAKNGLLVNLDAFKKNEQVKKILEDIEIINNLVLKKEKQPEQTEELKELQGILVQKKEDNLVLKTEEQPEHTEEQEELQEQKVLKDIFGNKTNADTMKKVFGFLGKLGLFLILVGAGGYALNQKFEFLPIIFNNSYIQKM